MAEQKISSSVQCGELQKDLLSQIVRNFTNFKKAPKERRGQGYLTSRLSLLEDDIKVARAYHQAIVGGGRLEATLKKEELLVIYEQLTDIYLEYKAELMDALEQCKKSSTAAAPSTCTLATTTNSSGNELRLPKIDIPKFAGSYTTWRSFHDLFKSMVHNNKALSNIEKLHYLKSSLRGEAERLLQHLQLDSDNYDKAWELLTSRYDHKLVLVNAQLKLLFGQPTLVKESTDGVKELLDTSQECIHALGNLELPVEKWDTIVIFVLLQKLPCSLQQLWEEKLGSTKELPTYEEFTEFLETRFRTLEVVEQQKGGSSYPGRSVQSSGVKQRSHADQSKVFVANQSSRYVTRRVCQGSQHALRRCTRFLNMDHLERKQTVKKIGVCENCLGYNHMVKECSSSKSCFFCQQRHHSLLHKNPLVDQIHTNESSQRQYSVRSTSSHAYQVAVNPNAPEFQPSGEVLPTTSATLNSFHALQKRESQILLATAVVKVKGSDGRLHQLRALIDPGSEATFISEAAAQLLKLKKKRTFVEVSGLGLVSSGTSDSYVELKFGSLHSTYESAVKALVFKSLTGLLPAQRMVPDKWHHLEGLRLADPQFGVPAQIDLLFGTDVFAEILLPDIVRSREPNTPLAQKTLLGWIVFGKVPAESPKRIRSFVQFTDLSHKLQKFLQNRWEHDVPDQPVDITTEEEKRAVKTYCTQGVARDSISQVIHRYSRLSKVVRVIASCLRFASNCRSPKGSRNDAPLTADELEKSRLLIVKSAQRDMFSDELTVLRKKGTSKQLTALNAFIDANNVLRVGGRLQNTALDYNEQHPILLRHQHHLTKLIGRDAHDNTLHGGIQQTIAYIRRTYWIGQIIRSVRYHIHRCTKCYRHKAQGMQQLMGSLSAVRVQADRPFNNTGVNYAGYFALFICMATKAIHIELVSDLTTQAFLAAFQRFVARRGICAHIYSDCGTNFVGASAELDRMLKNSQHDWKDVAGHLANKGIKWHFIPPASPHFGGLWEAGVKSVKHHLKRIVGSERLTFEELTTLLAQIEACLNSRPLCPLTESLDDLSAITPGHFLVGQALDSIPQGDSSTKSIGYLERWKRFQVLADVFWRKWSTEYLTRLQQRPKWAQTSATPKVGDLVLLKDERLPPLQWCLARIHQIHPGSDGLTRVVTLKTKNGIMKRPITKICYLPSNNTSEEQAIL